MTKGARLYGGMCVRGLPEDAVFQHLTYDHRTGLFFACFTAPSFDEVAEGDLIPELDVVYSEE
jgi:hypothetical protein